MWFNDIVTYITGNLMWLCFVVCAGDCLQNGSLDRLQERLQNTLPLFHGEHMVREREREGESERAKEGEREGGEKGRERGSERGREGERRGVRGWKEG